MKTRLSIKIFVVMISAELLAGCATSMTSDKVVMNSYESDLSGKVVRTRVNADEWRPGLAYRMAYFLKETPGPALLWNPGSFTDHAKKYRWVNTYVHTGPSHYSGYYARSFTLIPDHIPSLEEGDIVDVLYQKDEYGYDFDKLKSNIVVALVCKHDDSICLKSNRKSNKWGSDFGFEVEFDRSVVPTFKYSTKVEGA